MNNTDEQEPKFMTTKDVTHFKRIFEQVRMAKAEGLACVISGSFPDAGDSYEIGTSPELVIASVQNPQ